ncbi:ribonuclease H family protein [Rhabdothermincola salaria]|uniref:ribonuclease H family protein n=1 Tax=Rhabdothermincola salaria TaxID=2903142 RepID=UPI001E2942F3|nr:ribonuclease HI [Rhabdothermincola salaria]
MTTVAYTDGACKGNPGPGGWAWAVPGGAFASGAEAHSTNQRMEITAAFEAVKANPGPLEVVSDSTYVVHCFRDGWWEGWKRKGWLNSQRKPVANRDLWEPFVDLVVARGDVRFRWVKGHGGDPGNDLVDRLAVEAAETQQGRSGDSPPEEVGAPDRPGAPTRSAASVGTSGTDDTGSGTDGDLPGHPVVILGHRPPVVDPEADPEGAGILLDELLTKLVTLVERDPELVVVTGLRRGAEQLAAEAAVGAGVPYVAVLPWPDPATGWPEADRERFEELVGEADGVRVLRPDVPASVDDQRAAMARRDDWLARRARAALLVWDGHDEAMGRLHRTLVDHLGSTAVVVVAPPPPPPPPAPPGP